MTEEPSDFTYSQKSLETDSRLYADALSAYPYGFSFMPTADFDDEDTFAGVRTVGGILTFRWLNDYDDPNYDEGIQWFLSTGEAFTQTYGRRWDPNTDGWQATWRKFTMLTDGEQAAINSADAPASGNPFLTDSAFTNLLPNYVPLLALDFGGEADSVAGYPVGLSVMLVSAEADWGLNTGEAGDVETTRTDSGGKQVFTQYSDNLAYRRTHDGIAWSSWVALQ